MINFAGMVQPLLTAFSILAVMGSTPKSKAFLTKSMHTKSSVHFRDNNSNPNTALRRAMRAQEKLK